MPKRPTTSIDTSAEAVENAVLPQVFEVHTDPKRPSTTTAELPAKMQVPPAAKSPARWAYERLILYIQNFEKQLKADQEVAMGYTGGDAGVIRIEGMGYFDPDIITFYGSDERGGQMQIVQHVTQLNVMLTAMPVVAQAAEPQRIGFRLARELETATDATS